MSPPPPYMPEFANAYPLGLISLHPTHWLIYHRTLLHRYHSFLALCEVCVDTRKLSIGYPDTVALMSPQYAQRLLNHDIPTQIFSATLSLNRRYIKWSTAFGLTMNRLDPIMVQQKRMLQGNITGEFCTCRISLYHRRWRGWVFRERKCAYNVIERGTGTRRRRDQRCILCNDRMSTATARRFHWTMPFRFHPFAMQFLVLGGSKPV